MKFYIHTSNCQTQVVRLGVEMQLSSDVATFIQNDISTKQSKFGIKPRKNLRANTHLPSIDKLYKNLW